MYATLQKESSRSCLRAVAEGSFFVIPAAVVRRERLLPGQELDEEAFCRLKSVCEQEDCYDRALRLLGAREHTRFELCAKLRARGFASGVISPVMDRLEAEGSLDEVRFCLDFTESRLRKHPEGRLLMEKRLAARGAGREAVRQALDAVYTPDGAVEIAARALEGILAAAPDQDGARQAFAKAGFPLWQFESAKELVEEWSQAPEVGQALTRNGV